jgi:uncharacterized protein YcfJ
LSTRFQVVALDEYPHMVDLTKGSNKMRQLSAIISAVWLAGAAASASAGHAQNDVYYDEARVLSVTPQTERVNEPRQECRTEYVRETVSEAPRERSLTGPIIGGITGGLLGSRVGRGSGRVAAAAVGAGIGAIVGDRVDNNDRSGYYTAERPVERCVSTDHWVTVNRGYQVAYRYNGRDYSTVMPYDPGHTVRVRVDVVPADGDRVVSYSAPLAQPAVYGASPRRGYGHRHHRYD